MTFYSCTVFLCLSWCTKSLANWWTAHFLVAYIRIEQLKVYRKKTVGAAAVSKLPGRLVFRFYSNYRVGVATASRKERFSELYAYSIEVFYWSIWILCWVGIIKVPCIRCRRCKLLIKSQWPWITTEWEEFKGRPYICRVPPPIYSKNLYTGPGKNVCKTY